MLLNFKEYICPVSIDNCDYTLSNKRLKSFKDWYMEMAQPTPECPKCGLPMVLRTRKVDSRQFYGCSGFPKCNGTKGYKATDSQSQPQSPQPQPQSRPQPQAPLSPRAFWVYAKIVKQGDPRFASGQDVAVLKQPNGDWSYLRLAADGSPHNGNIDGVIHANELQSTLQSYRANGQPLTSQQPSIVDLKKQLGIEAPAAKEKEEFTPTEEQAAIEKRFGEMIADPSQSHMMINALAGTGKTTTLKELAKKFGNSDQRWLYLVFNTKNKVEATEKFPRFVQVRTTNGFLGEVLRDKKNFTKIPQTERIANLSNYRGGDDEGGGPKLEKARLLADGPDFSAIMAKHGIPNKQASAEEMGKVANTVNSLMKSIKFQFKEQVLTLAGLAKSFALDPRQDHDEGLNKILNSYDFDTELSDVKERISKYSGSFKSQLLDELEYFLGYDFMSHDFKDGIKDATKWMLQQSMPNATNQKHRHGTTDHNLGEFRDFNDDLWYAAIHGNDLHWPHFDVVMADEVQDFNEAQKIMLQKLHDAGAKIVAVGDPNQSIYRFRGADSEAFNNIADTLTNLSSNKDVVKTLSKNFRSRPEILDFANSETHVKNLVAGKQFKDGLKGITSKGDVKYTNAFDTLKSENANKTLKETAFISRTNEPLVHAALQLLSNNIPFVILGKDISKELKKHIKKITARFNLSDHDTLDDLKSQLEGFKQDELDNHHGKAVKKAYLQELEEITTALIAAADQCSQDSYGDNNTIGQFNRWISQRLGGLDVEENEKDLKAYKEKMEKEKPVVLTTAHKSKGLEFSRVYILRYDQFPHKKAVRPADLKQEDNAKYVAITRAKDEIHILKLDGQPGYVAK